MKLVKSALVTCSFKFQVMTDDDGKIQTHPNILVSFNNGDAPMILRPHHPDLGYQRNLEDLLHDSHFCCRMAESLYKAMAEVLLPTDANEVCPEDQKIVKR
jgi:hypothetical protein